jgi:hypothetical protein
MNMKFTEYNIRARFAPAILCTMPLIILAHFFLTPAILGKLTSLVGITYLGDVSLGTLLVYFFAQINRSISKEVFQKKIFSDELHMPTTNFLLFSDSLYTVEYKKKIHAKIFDDFNIKLFSEAQEAENESEARKK